MLRDLVHPTPNRSATNAVGSFYLRFSYFFAILVTFSYELLYQMTLSNVKINVVLFTNT